MEPLGARAGHPREGRRRRGARRRAILPPDVPARVRRSGRNAARHLRSARARDLRRRPRGRAAVNPAAAKRTLALAGVALLAALVSLALAAPDRKHGRTLPKPVGTWYPALAEPYSPAAARGRTACGQRIDARTLGVAHPVLPCGARIYISYGGRKVLTQVIDRGPSAPGREFDVTKALADEIGLHGTKRIRWSYAR